MAAVRALIFVGQLGLIGYGDASTFRRASRCIELLQQSVRVRLQLLASQKQGNFRLSPRSWQNCRICENFRVVPVTDLSTCNKMRDLKNHSIASSTRVVRRATASLH